MIHDPKIGQTVRISYKCTGKEEIGTIVDFSFDEWLNETKADVRLEDGHTYGVSFDHLYTA